MARKTFIKNLVKKKTIDHQIRRAYLEVVFLRILSNQNTKVLEDIKEYQRDAPGAMNSDEYNALMKIVDMLCLTRDDITDANELMAS